MPEIASAFTEPQQSDIEQDKVSVLRVRRAAKEYKKWDDVGDGTVSPNEWPYYVVTLTLEHGFVNTECLVVAHVQGAPWKRAVIRDARAVKPNRIEVEVSLNPDFYDKTRDLFTPFTVAVSALGVARDSSTGGA